MIAYSYDDHAIYRAECLRIVRPSGLSLWSWLGLAQGLCLILNRYKPVTEEFK